MGSGWAVNSRRAVSRRIFPTASWRGLELASCLCFVCVWALEVIDDCRSRKEGLGLPRETRYSSKWISKARPWATVMIGFSARHKLEASKSTVEVLAVVWESFVVAVAA